MLHAQGKLPAEIHIKNVKCAEMSLDIMNGVNVVLVLNMANQLVLWDLHSLFLALWMVTVMGSVCSYCISACSGEMLHSFYQPRDQLCIRIAK